MRAAMRLPNPKQESHPVDWLRVEYARRRQANPSYSLRAFAKALAVPPGRLSEIFEGKRQLTAAIGAQVADRLNLLPEERRAFLALIAARKKDRRLKAERAGA